MPSPTLFSKQIGEAPNFLRGRSFLLEVDSSSPYEKAVRDFVDELLKDGCAVYILTHRSSPVYKLLSNMSSVTFYISTPTVSYPKKGAQQNEVLVPQNDSAINLDLISKAIGSSRGGCVAIVIDSISDMLISSSFEATYKFLKNANEVLGGQNVTSMFLSTRGIHDSKVIASIRSLFSEHLVSLPDGGAKLTKKP